MFVNGAWTTAEDVFEATSPVTGEVIGVVQKGGRGWVNINESSNYWETHLPFGGRSGTASGIGRVGGSAPMEAFSELQTIVIG